MNPDIDRILDKATRWQPEMKELRRILLDCMLTEEVKWHQPCYTFRGSNLFIIGSFKEYCSLTFFKGALLRDEQGILSRPGENTQSARTAKFTRLEDIRTMEPVLKAYILESMELEKSGAKVSMKKTEDFDVPAELLEKFAEAPAVEEAFKALTPGRQRAYLLHFAQAKQSATRRARIEKFVPQILAGKGMLD